ncbi:hypothetical protein CTAYLR_008386 [Chrysophaeum taylorii]|uniref:RRM domain-containing protein n=1 Tax=Chrysophaeum taylorii TaxID=2483200 RepID=A0AAD7UHE2_9STRA|nr:hypothetical protein CTAYLR_008386 [Chrysophaeum taylorii]
MFIVNILVGAIVAGRSQGSGDVYTTVNHCRRQELIRCRDEYEKCMRESGGPAGEGYPALMCACSDQYYGICVRRAGCAAALMSECVDTLEKWGCEDSSVCGLNCMGNNDNNNLIDEDAAHMLSVNNYGHNFLRFTVCFRKHDERSLDHFSMILMERCSGDLFQECPYWVPPETTTAIAISRNVSMLRMEFCVYSSSDNDYRCLSEPRPREFYGTEVLFPDSVDVGLPPVDNVDFGAGKSDIHAFFSGALSVELPMRRGCNRGFAFVEFTSEAQLEAALDRNGEELRGRKLRISRKSADWTGKSGDGRLGSDKKSSSRQSLPAGSAYQETRSAPVADDSTVVVAHVVDEIAVVDESAVVVNVGVCRLKLGPVAAGVVDVAKEDIGSLPPFSSICRVEVASTVAEAIAGVRALRERLDSGACTFETFDGTISALGFDTETKPVFRKGQAPNKVALVQLAARDLVVLFRLSLYECPKQLKLLLEDGEVLKVGCGAASDASDLKARIPGLRPRGYVDVDKLVAARFPNVKRCGLRGAVAACGNMALSKGQSTANWELRAMKPAMISYAANDAVAGLFLFAHVLSSDYIAPQSKDARRGISRGDTPPTTTPRRTRSPPLGMKQDQK